MEWCWHLIVGVGREYPAPCNLTEVYVLTSSCQGSLGPIAEAAFEVPGLTLPVCTVLLVCPLEKTLCSPGTPRWPCQPLTGQDNRFLFSIYP